MNFLTPRTAPVRTAPARASFAGTRRHALAGLFLLAAAAAPAWEGWNWEQWRERTGASPPAITSPQAGRMELVPLLQADDPAAGSIESIQAWEAKRDRILGTLGALLGPEARLAFDRPEHPPGREAPAVPHRHEGEPSVENGIVRRKVVLLPNGKADGDAAIPLWILRPAEGGAAPRASEIVIHQTVAQGKDEPAGIRGDSGLALALDLARRGFIALAPDMPGFGERIPPGAAPYAGATDALSAKPGTSYFGRMIADIQSVVDFILREVPEADPRRIGIVGHSHGAYAAVMAAAFDPRISAAAASCGFTLLRADSTPERWSRLTALAPAWGFFADPAAAPFDWHEVAALLAPRPFFYWGALEDAGFPNTGRLIPVFEEIRRVYGLYGAAGALEPVFEPGPHGFPPGIRDRAFAFLETSLPPRPPVFDAVPDAPESRRAWQAAFRASLTHDLGPVDPPADLPPSIEAIEGSEKEGYLEAKISYLAEADEPVQAWLLTPAEAAASGTRRPGLVLFHQTVPEGKDEPAGLAGRPSMRLGPELALRGFTVLIPDSICAGERITEAGAYDTRDFYRANPEGSALGKMIRDGRRAVSILASLPGVDPERIGCLGHSLGAEEALFVAAFDERVKAAAASCGFAPFHAEKNPERWARAAWFSYMPRLRREFRAGRAPAWDFPSVIALVAPRGYYHHQTRGDEIFPEAAAIEPWLAGPLKGVWQGFGRPEALGHRMEDGPHDLSPEGRAAMFQWLEERLTAKP